MAVNGIQIKGRMYGNSKFTTLKFFLNSRQNATSPISWATVLGRNGAGKSTISTALWKLAHNQSEQPTQQSENDNLEAILSPNNGVGTDNIYIFNDDFIRAKLKFDTDEIGAVLMLKEQEDVKERIQAAEGKKAVLLSEIAALQYDLGIDDAKSETPENKNSANGANRLCALLKNEKDELTHDFKKEGGWAETVSQIRNHRQNEAATIRVINNLYDTYKDQLSDLATIGQQQVKLKDRLYRFNKLQSIQSDGTKNIQAPDKEILTNLIISVRTALNTRPEPTQDENNSIIKLLQSDSSIFDITLIKEFFSQQPAPERCDKCLQVINSEWRDAVLNAITQITANNEIHDLLSKLSRCKDATLRYQQEINNIDVPSDLLTLLEEQRFHESKNELLDDLNVVISDIKKKVNSPYAVVDSNLLGSPQESDKPRIIYHLEEFLAAISKINESIRTRSDQLEEERSQLIHDETVLTCSIYKSTYDKYKTLSDKAESKKTDLKNAQQELAKVQSHIQILNNQLGQFNIAMDKINESLRLVFLSPDRLQLETSPESDNAYAISVRGKRVPLHDLSTGEKNAIAIAYYFSMPYENKVEHPLFNESMLFVLDDPITSLDRSNEIGIFSLIEKEFTSLKKALSHKKQPQPSLQILVMTHNYQVFYAMQHIGESVFPRKKTAAWVLSDCDIKAANNNKPAYTYRTLIEHVYDFAKRDMSSPAGDESHDYTIANELRRALEEYSWFNFGVGGSGLRKQALIRSNLDELVKENRLSSESEDLILSVLYSIWTNSGSHREENANSDIQDLDLLNYNDTNEVRKIAKLVLILLDEIHFTGLPGLMWGSSVSTDKSCYKECRNYLDQWKSSFSSKKA